MAPTTAAFNSLGFHGLLIKRNTSLILIACSAAFSVVFHAASTSRRSSSWPIGAARSAIWSSPTALLAELRSLGGHVGRDRFAGLRTPRWRQQLMAALQRRADPQGRIMLGFELVYGHAYKAASRVSKAETTTVSLDQLRATLPKRNT